MIIHIQFVCNKIISKKREFEWEEEEDLNNPIGVICFNHAIFLAAQGFHIRAEVGDQADKCPLCNHPELYLDNFPELRLEGDESSSQFLNYHFLPPTPILVSNSELESKITSNPPQEDILGYDIDHIGWWKCRTCGYTYHPSRFKSHMKDCHPKENKQ